MKIIKNELKKILKSKAIIIASVIFLILNLFNIYLAPAGDIGKRIF